MDTVNVRLGCAYDDREVRVYTPTGEWRIVSEFVTLEGVVIAQRREMVVAPYNVAVKEVLKDLDCAYASFREQVIMQLEKVTGLKLER